MDAVDVTDGKSKKSTITKNDWKLVAEELCQKLQDRKSNRKDLEKDWKEIDRQLRMEPDLSHKQINGKNIPHLSWLPETELPLQSQTLEVLNADARRMLEADNWFEANAAMTDKYLDRVDFQSLVAGDENDVPSLINQDNANKLTQGAMMHWQDQYDFWGNVDLINSDAFKYSAGVGVVRAVEKQVIKLKGMGAVRKSEVIPVLVPRSIKKTYLDDSAHAVMNEGVILGPLQIYCYTQRWEDLVLAAKKGSKNADSIMGGWKPENLKGLEGDGNGNIEIIEGEGDFVVPKKTGGSLVIPNAIVTVAKSGDDARVVRVRLMKYGQSHIVFPYHMENIESAYGTSPLMKGWPIQKTAVDALNRFLIVAALHGQPPVQFDRDDAQFAQEGGPLVYPGVQWPTTGDIKLHSIGDPTALFNAYMGLLQQYADVTGVNASRLGAQTVSHTTAYAKEAELSRGTIRTVDYVNSTLSSPLTQWLYKSFEIGRSVMKESTFYIPSYNGFVTIDKDKLPDMVAFEAHGSGGPSEEQAKQEKRFAGLQMVLNIDQLEKQSQAAGLPATIDYQAVKEQVLRDAGWTDIDVLIGGIADAQGAAGQPGMGQPNEAVAAAPGAALQALALAGQ